MSGRLAIEKGHAFVIKLFAELKKSDPELKLVLIGDGPQRESIINLCISLMLTVDYKKVSLRLPDVFITGEVQNVFNHLRKATLYILNSSSEGFPNGLTEAMASGLTVLAADCPYGPREILSPTTTTIQNGNAEFAEYGILLPLDSFSKEKAAQEVWLGAITSVLKSPHVRAKYSELGLKRVREFSKAKIVNQWRKVIETLQ
jgi:glycosyltransferase involved in cell wall biosynthesis